MNESLSLARTLRVRGRSDGLEPAVTLLSPCMKGISFYEMFYESSDIFLKFKTRFVFTLAFLVKSDLSFLVNSVTIISKMYLKLIFSDTLKLMTEFGFNSFSGPGT